MHSECIHLKHAYSKTRVIIITLILLLALPLLTLPPRATAWTGGTIYIRSDGSIDPPDAPLSRVGETYYVTADINIESGKGIVIERDNITLDGNNHSIIGKEFSTGVYLYGVMNVIMRNIVIQGFSYGIWLEYSSNNTITGNNITTNIFDSSGITLLKYSSNNTITENNIMNSAYGIWLEDSSNNTITGNNIQFTKSVYGIRLKYSSNSTITGNNITNSNFGISLEYSSNNVISGNNITINGYGILLSLSNHNTIFGNNIMNNNFGIGLWGDNNVIFHNNFINNTYQVALVEVGTNAWDDGYPSGGNYWSDYNGVDVKSGPNQDQPGSDGIGDTPYVISSLDVDHYPLMKPWASHPTPTPTPTPQTALLVFNVIYGGQVFTVSIEVPLEKYNDAKQAMGDLYAEYPGIGPSLLEEAYYLHLHASNPVEYPLTRVHIIENGQQVSDKNMKAEILAGLLTYCYELFPALSQHQLNAYQNYGYEWRRLYDDAKTMVIVSTKLTHYIYLATVVGPILDVIKSGGIGFSQAMEIKNTISFAFDLWTLSHDELAIKYGTEAVNDIINILIKHKFLSSSDYDPSELYVEMMSNPSEALNALKEIEEEVFNIRLESDAENVINKFLFNLASELLFGYTKEITSTALTSLILYYKNQLTEEISYQLVESMYADILKYEIPLSLASAIEKSYNIPMADAIYSAWESEGNISNIYYKMYNYGYEITHPQDTTLNLTKSKIWSGLAGLEYIYEYRYYDLRYYITHAEFLRGITNPSEWQSDLTWYSNAAQAALSHAEDWENTLVNILALSQCDVESYDPGGVNFNLEFSPPPRSSPFPVVPENSSGFAVIANGTSSITLSSGNYKFIVENRTWFSNFTYSLYVDDAYGNSYLIVFNPPQQQYSVEVENETLLTVKNFALTNEGVTISDAGGATGKHIVFNVVGSNVDPASVKVVPYQVTATIQPPPTTPPQTPTTTSTSTTVVATPGLELIIGIVVMVGVGISLIMAFRKYKTKP